MAVCLNTRFTLGFVAYSVAYSVACSIPRCYIGYILQNIIQGTPFPFLLCLWVVGDARSGLPALSLG